jgi:hypothetical protein
MNIIHEYKESIRSYITNITKDGGYCGGMESYVIVYIKNNKDEIIYETDGSTLKEAYQKALNLYGLPPKIKHKLQKLILNII